jgi:hypothetical protein
MEQTPLGQTPLPAPQVSPTKSKGTSAGSVLLFVAALVAVAGVTFAVGRMTAPTSSGTGNGGFARGSFIPRGSFAPGAGLPGGALAAGSLTLEGTVAGVGNGSLTLKLATGSTLEVKTDSSTTYHRQAAASASDVAVGSTVLVRLSALRGLAGGRAAASAVPGASASPAAGASPGLAAAESTAQDVTVVQP